MCSQNVPTLLGDWPERMEIPVIENRPKFLGQMLIIVSQFLLVQLKFNDNITTVCSVIYNHLAISSSFSSEIISRRCIDLRRQTHTPMEPKYYVCKSRAKSTVETIVGASWSRSSGDQIRFQIWEIGDQWISIARSTTDGVASCPLDRRTKKSNTQIKHM